MTFREKVATFRTIFADPGKKTTLAKELVSRGVFLNIAVLTDDLIHAGTERLAKTMETDGWKREKAATGCIIFGVLAGSAINPRQLGAFALAGLAMWGLSKTYKSDLSDLGAKMMMMVRGGATVLTIFGVLQAFY